MNIVYVRSTARYLFSLSIFCSLVSKATIVLFCNSQLFLFGSREKKKGRKFDSITAVLSSLRQEKHDPFLYI